MKAVFLSMVLVVTVPVGALGQEACEAQRVVSPAEVSAPDFAYRVRTNGHHWFASSTDANTLCPGPVLSCSTGAVFVHELVGGELTHTQTIVPSGAELYDNFGKDLDVCDGRLVVGSLYTRRAGSDERPGAVFTYEHDGVRWIERDRLEPPLSVTREFGNTVKLLGDILIVTPQSSQRFYMYERDSGAWNLKQVVQAPEPLVPAGSGFGLVWAVQGDWVVTSAYLDRRVRINGGTVFIYRRQPDGTLELTQQISAVDERLHLGTSLAFDGQTLVVGAPQASREYESQGVVQFYEFEGGQWVLSGELVASAAGYNDQFGQTVALHEDTLLVNAYNDVTPDTRGVVHRFDRQPGGSWIETGTLDPNPPSHTGRYGGVLATDGRHALVGAYEESAAYFFDLTCGDCKPDLDLDGALTVFDFLTFLNHFQDASPTADFDGDGEFTIFDFLAFQTAFDAGCE